jgi:pyruvate dehydrogenase E1 component alpha subunit
VPRSRQSRSKTLAQKALAYGMPGIQVDGNDILAVYSAAGKAVELARSGNGPTMIECVIYRMSVHTTADDPRKYRSEKEEEQWQGKDPLVRFRTYLEAKDLLGNESISSMTAEIEEEIGVAINSWEKKQRTPVSPDAMFDHVFAEPSPYMKEQKANFEEEALRMSKRTMIEAINLALHQEMEKDEEVIVLGEDLGVDGGIFRVTESL